MLNSAMVNATSASASQTASQPFMVRWRIAKAAAISAVAPIAHKPQPETAVDVELRVMLG
jgi:hypothetical protein